MAPNWRSTPNGGHHQQGPPSQTRGPPPICFKCGCEGHFVVNCPQGGQPNPLSLDSQAPSHDLQPNHANGAGGPHGGIPQGSQWPNNQNGAQAAYYPHPPNAAAPGPYPHYPGPVQPVQSYPPHQQGPYQAPPNQQYGQYGAPYGYSQPPQQAYEAYPPNPQYNNQGYGQYPPQNGPPQPGYSGYPTAQPYAPPHAASPYNQSPTPYPPQASPYAPPQWNNSQPAPYDAGHFQQPNEPNWQQYNPGAKINTSGYSRRQFQPQQSTQMSPQTPHSASYAQYTPSSARQGSVASNSHVPITGETTMASGNGKTHLSSRVSGEGKPMEEGEVPEYDLLDEDFKWELEKIFKKGPQTENVMLAQPLSTKFDMTPVPLIHIGTAPSVSRYARADNMKDFIKPIRSQPQWSYLQEDPAFSDAEMQGELIPLEEVLIWTATRQGVDPESLVTRKRERPNKDRQFDADLSPYAELGNGDIQAEHQEGEEADQDMPDACTVEAQGTPSDSPGTRTPTLDRAGTPSLNAEDDVWAPQPGEGALSVPVNPTEALLASLGVSGSPKPVRKRSVPHLSISTGEDSSRKRPKTVPSQDSSGHGEPQPKPPSHSQHGRGGRKNHPTAYDSHGKPCRNKALPYNRGYDNRSGTSQQHSYGNQMSPQNISPYNNVQYSVSPHSQYPNAPQDRNAPQGMQQQGSYGNPQHGVPPQNHGPPQFQDPWAAPRQGNHSEQPPHQMTQNGHTAYAATSQAPHATGPHGQPKHNGTSSHQPFHSADGNHQWSRRNSGHANYRRSHSKEANTITQKQVDGSDDDISSPPVKTPVLSECLNSKGSDTNDPDESPLTPTSAEILGKLTQPTRKDSDDTARRLRRPQPVVAAAYSRRW